MSLRVILAFVALSLAFVVATACEQGEGERCQMDSDCEPLTCVGEDGTGGEDGDGHCCPTCTTGTPNWEYIEEDDAHGCVCRTGAVTDGDADSDADTDADADGDSEGDAEGDADGDSEGDADSGGDADGPE